MEEVKTKGIVIKTSEFGEGHKTLTLLTSELGIIHALSYGARKTSRSKSAESQLLAWGEYILRPKRGGLYQIVSVTPAEGFYPIYEDIQKLALISYFSELVTAALDYGNPDRDVFRLFLNTAYALAYTDTDESKIKAVFELRLVSECGFAPVTDECAACGARSAAVFSAADGGILCAECAGVQGTAITENARRAMSYIVHAEPKKIFSFNVPPEDAAVLDRVAEQYAGYVLERGFKSLEYYKKISVTV